MSQTPLLITGKNIVLENGLSECALFVEDGRISGILSPAAGEALAGTIPGIRRIDAGENFVLPGAVDEHAHMWEPSSHPEREDWTSGSECAASGGITTLIEMAQGEPPATTVAGLENKKKIAGAKSVVDFSFWGGCTGAVKGADGSIEVPGACAVEELHDAGCTSFKVFTAWFGPGFASLSDFELYETMERVAAVGGVLGVHCENSNLCDGFEARLAAQGRKTGKAHEEGRPVITETESIARVLLFAKATGCRIVILHLATPEALPLIMQARMDGVEVWVETTASYLTMNTDDLEKHGAHAKCAPPVRSEESRLGLWDMVRDGFIDCVASDHFPFFDSERDEFSKNIFAAPSGMGGFDSMLPRLVDEGVHRQDLSWEMLARLVATNPALIHGLYPRKGAIRLGADADLVIVDPEARWTYSGKNTLSRVKSLKTPLEGKQLRGKVLETLVRGETVYKDGEIMQKAGFGEYIRPLP